MHFKGKFNLDELPVCMVDKQIYNPAAMIPSLDLMVFSSLGGNLPAMGHFLACDTLQALIG